MTVRFVIKATGPCSDEAWLGVPDRDGFRDLVEVRRAAVFATQELAQLAINAMPAAFADLGIRFAIEPHRRWQ
jgi:hypothetical protein